MRIPLFGIGLQGKSPRVTAKKLQNFYCEFRPEGERTRVVAYGTPGLVLFADFGDTPVRGMCSFEPADLLYVVHRGTLWEVNNAGAVTSRGTLDTTSGRVSMTHNGLQVMIVDGTEGYTYTLASTTFAKITGVDFPDNPEVVAFQDGYFIVNDSGTGRFYISALYDGTAWDALDFASAETNPDDLINIIADKGELILWGPVTAEFWGNTGAADFPYARIQGAASEWGLAARWSLAKFDNSLIGLVKNRMGEVMVATLAGYLPRKVSTQDLDTVINGYSSVGDATGFSYMVNGHPMYQINFPTADASWLYDGSTGIWTKVKGYGIGRHRAEIQAHLVAKTIVSDYEDGRLYRLDDDAYTDAGSPIEGEIIGEHIESADRGRFPVERLRLDMETGVGLVSGQGSDPQVMLQVSRDNGQTWGTELWASAGKIGEYKKRVEWRRLGSSDSHTFRLRITDPVKRVIINAMVNPDD